MPEAIRRYSDFVEKFSDANNDHSPGEILQADSGRAGVLVGVDTLKAGSDGAVDTSPDVFEITSVDGSTQFNAGDPVYWDSANDKAVKEAPASGFYLGRAHAGTSSNGANVLVRLNEPYDGVPTVEGNVQGLSDDAVHNVVPSSDYGRIYVMDDNQDYIGLFYDLVNGTVADIASNGSAVSATGDHTGTTGTDGNLTVAADSANGQIDIENRTGGARNVYFQVEPMPVS